ncbi:hypothetical protein KXW54_004012 [Aspergillus fumigatus]|nr:hypothetical protein KXV71_005360 [Aspergillus fumigatus]KAH2632799.1 hypothetical protein KXW54_004012 [Aspergillus fumigatus]KAH2777166.1 hypothetical protein KXV54_004344 [Aspergillus fumigatus]
MAAGLAIAGDFSKSCDDITLEDSRYLVAECQRKNSSSQVTKLDLNACYGNNGFSLKAEPSGGAFSDPLFRRCSVVGSHLSCQQKAKGIKGSKSTRIFHDLGKLITAKSADKT